MDKKISVIVPIYNTEKYLKKCVDSILSQTYRNLEVVLVDDGSTDGSGKICDEYAENDARVRVIHKENGGLSSARNAGLDAATGDFIAFVDSDDRISPDIYEKMACALGDEKDVIANCMYVREDEDGKIFPSSVPHTEDESLSSEQLLCELLMHTGDVSACTKLYPREVLENLRFPEGILNEDFVFMLSLTERIKGIRFVGFVGYYYFVRRGSISSGYGRAFEDMQKNALYALDFVKKKYPSLKKRAMRFALYQNMAYLLALPHELATRDNEVYRSAKRFVRRHAFANLFNAYLTARQKLILLSLTVMPRVMAKKYQRKNGR